MANIILPSGEAIWYADSLTPYSAATISSNEASSLKTLMDHRERYDFEWANAGQRSAEVGMRQGSRGYQVDTRTEYLYDGGAWRLAVSFWEGTSSTGSIATGTAATAGTFSPTSATTDTSMVVNISNGRMELARPGIYLVTLVGKDSANGPLSGQSQVVINDQSMFSNVAGRIANQTFGGALMATAVKAGFVTTVPNTPIWFYFYNDSGANKNVNTTVSIVRLG